jgi:hypothetical protein
VLFLNTNPFDTMPTTVKNSDLREALLGAQPNSANAGQHSVQEQAQAADEPSARFWQTYMKAANKRDVKDGLGCCSIINITFDFTKGLLWLQLWWSNEEHSKLGAWRHYGFAPPHGDTEQRMRVEQGDGDNGSDDSDEEEEGRCCSAKRTATFCCAGNSSGDDQEGSGVRAPQTHGAGDDNFLGLGRSEEQVACDYEQYQTSETGWINSWFMRDATLDIRVMTVVLLAFLLPFFAPFLNWTGPAPFMMQRTSMLAGTWYAAARASMLCVCDIHAWVQLTTNVHVKALVLARTHVTFKEAFEGGKPSNFKCISIGAVTAGYMFKLLPLTIGFLQKYATTFSVLEGQPSLAPINISFVPPLSPVSPPSPPVWAPLSATGSARASAWPWGSVSVPVWAPPSVMAASAAAAGAPLPAMESARAPVPTPPAEPTPAPPTPPPTPPVEPTPPPTPEPTPSPFVPTPPTPNVPTPPPSTLPPSPSSSPSPLRQVMLDIRSVLVTMDFVFYHLPWITKFIVAMAVSVMGQAFAIFCLCVVALPIGYHPSYFLARFISFLFWAEWIRLKRVALAPKSCLASIASLWSFFFRKIIFKLHVMTRAMTLWYERCVDTGTAERDSGSRILLRSNAAVGRPTLFGTSSATREQWRARVDSFATSYLTVQGLLILPLFAILTEAFVCAKGEDGYVLEQDSSVKCSWNLEYAFMMAGVVLVGLWFFIVDTFMKALWPLSQHVVSILAQGESRHKPIATPPLIVLVMNVASVTLGGSSAFLKQHPLLNAWCLATVNLCIAYVFGATRLRTIRYYPSNNGEFNLIQHCGWFVAANFAVTVAIAATIGSDSANMISIILVLELGVVAVYARYLWKSDQCKRVTFSTLATAVKAFAERRSGAWGDQAIEHRNVVEEVLAKKSGEKQLCQDVNEIFSSFVIKGSSGAGTRRAMCKRDFKMLCRVHYAYGSNGHFKEIDEQTDMFWRELCDLGILPDSARTAGEAEPLVRKKVLLQLLKFTGTEDRGGGTVLPVPGQSYHPPQPQQPQVHAVELVSSGEGARGRVRLGTILAAGQRKKNPRALVGERVRVFDGKSGEREGTVVDVHSTFGGSTTHAIMFDGGNGTPEPTLLQKGSDASKGLRFHVLERGAASASVDDTSWRRPVASIASIRTSNVAKYSVGQHVQDMGASGVSGRVVSAVADSGTSGPGLLTVDPSGASQPPVNPLAAH